MSFLEGQNNVGFYAVAAVALVLLAYTTLFKPSKLNMTRVGMDTGFLGLNATAAKNDFYTNGYKIVEDAYWKLRDKNYFVQTQDQERVVLAPKFLPEVKSLPEKFLSHRASIAERHLGKYNGMDVVMQSHLHSDVCRVQMTNHLPLLVPAMNDELAVAMSEFMAKVTAKSFVLIPAYPFALTMIARISSRAFIGLPICRSKEWMGAVMTYPMDIAAVAAALRPWPAYVRPFMAPFLSAKKRLAQNQATIHKLLDPVIAERRPTVGEDKPLDVLQWMVDSGKGIDAEPHNIILKLMMLTMAAFHTSTMAVVHALYDLCSMPEYIEALREEALTALKEDGSWQLKTLNRLDKLDSFLKESQRMNHPGLFGLNRKVGSPVTLSDGTVVPTGLIINFAAESMAKDPAYYDNPKEFDGYRFYKRQQAAEKAKVAEHEFSGIQPGNLAWGLGRFTCPGRWYASAQIKLLLATILTEYDFSFPVGQSTRPPNTHADEKIAPDGKQQILFRKRQ